jgi:hypothetical protein
LPSFAHHFGIKPWEVADLTYGEVEDFLAAIKQLNKPPPKGGPRG